MSVFASSDGRHVFIARTGTSVTEIPASGRGPDLELTAPRGWYVSAKPTAVAGGIVVQSADEEANPRPATIAAWHLLTDAVTVIGQTVASAYFGPISAVTPPGADYSLIAWMPSRCKLLINCPVQVTNTATGSGIALHSPMPHGFVTRPADVRPAGSDASSRSGAGFAREDKSVPGAVVLASA